MIKFHYLFTILLFCVQAVFPMSGAALLQSTTHQFIVQTDDRGGLVKAGAEAGFVLYGLIKPFISSSSTSLVDYSVFENRVALLKQILADRQIVRSFCPSMAESAIPGNAAEMRAALLTAILDKIKANKSLEGLALDVTEDLAILSLNAEHQSSQ